MPAADDDRLGPRGLRRLADGRARARDHAGRRPTRWSPSCGPAPTARPPWCASSPAWSPPSAPPRSWWSTGRAGSRPTPTASPRCFDPLVDKLQERRRARRPRFAEAVGSRVTGARGRRPARLHVLARCWASSTRSTTTPGSTARPAAAGRAQHRARRARDGRRPHATSGSGCACTRRPTGCSSPPCRGCATTSTAQIERSSATSTSTRPRSPRWSARASSGSATCAPRRRRRQPARPVRHARAAGGPRPDHRGDVAARGPRRRGDGRRRARGDPVASSDIRASSTSAARAPAPLDRLLRRLLGLDAKMAQYRDGAALRARRRRPGRHGRLQRGLGRAGQPARPRPRSPTRRPGSRRVHG